MSLFSGVETMMDSVPETIAGRLQQFGQPFERIGLEAGPLSVDLCPGPIVALDIRAANFLAERV
jgi:hypothetical protein